MLRSPGVCTNLLQSFWRGNDGAWAIGCHAHSNAAIFAQGQLQGKGHECMCVKWVAVLQACLACADGCNATHDTAVYAFVWLGQEVRNIACRSPTFFPIIFLLQQNIHRGFSRCERFKNAFFPIVPQSAHELPTTPTHMCSTTHVTAPPHYALPLCPPQRAALVGSVSPPWDVLQGLAWGRAGPWCKPIPPVCVTRYREGVTRRRIMLHWVQRVGYRLQDDAFIGGGSCHKLEDRVPRGPCITTYSKLHTRVP